MNCLLRPRIWESFLASSGHVPCDVLSSTSRVRVPAVARWHTHLHGFVTTIHEISGLGVLLFALRFALCDTIGRPVSFLIYLNVMLR